jgi:hypothetical protein
VTKKAEKSREYGMGKAKEGRFQKEGTFMSDAVG